jgi:hypothetical protein
MAVNGAFLIHVFAEGGYTMMRQMTLLLVLALVTLVSLPMLGCKTNEVSD